MAVKIQSPKTEPRNSGAALDTKAPTPDSPGSMDAPEVVVVSANEPEAALPSGRDFVNRMPDTLLEAYPGLTQQMTRASLERDMAEAFRQATIETDRRAAPFHAVVIDLMARLISRFKVKNEEIAKVVFAESGDMDSAVPLSEKLVISGPRGREARPTRREIVGSEKPKPGGVYRGQVVRHLFLAKIHAVKTYGLALTKTDPTPPEVVLLNGIEYRSPVDALSVGETLTGCYVAWKNIMRPAQENLSNRPLLLDQPGRETAKHAEQRQAADREAAKSQIHRFTVTGRRFDAGKGGDVRKNLSVAGNRAATLGAVEGLLAKFDDWTEIEVVTVLGSMGYTGTVQPKIKPETQPAKPETPAE